MDKETIIPEQEVGNTTLDIMTKGDLSEVQENQEVVINKNMTEILGRDGEMVTITEENAGEYVDIFPSGSQVFSNMPQEYNGLPLVSEGIRILPISKYGTKEKKLEVASKMSLPTYNLIGSRMAKLSAEEIAPLAEGSGTYVRVGVYGPDMLGNDKMRFPVQFWASSSSVFNSDGQDIRIWRSWQGQSSISTVLGTLWGADLGKYVSSRWTYNYDWTMPSSWCQIEADTKDRLNDSRFYAKSGVITVYRAEATASISSVSQTGNTISFSYRAPQGEKIVHHEFNSSGGAYWGIKTPPKTGSSHSSYSFTLSLPRNFAGSMTYGFVSQYGSTSSPWAWSGVKSINVATSFTSMSMPTVSASRDSSNPGRIHVSWTAGGTTNKPMGGASRAGSIILRLYNSDGSWTNLGSKSANLEVAGSTYFDNIRTDVEFAVFAEYSVSGLSGGTQWQSSNRVTIGKAGGNAKVKVGGSYKNVSETYIKVGGAYKRVVETYIKVGGVYKKVVN